VGRTLSLTLSLFQLFLQCNTFFTSKFTLLLVFANFLSPTVTHYYYHHYFLLLSSFQTWINFFYILQIETIISLGLQTKVNNSLHHEDIVLSLPCSRFDIAIEIDAACSTHIALTCKLGRLTLLPPPNFSCDSTAHSYVQ